MARFRHTPGHPLADEKGWVELNDDYYKYLSEVDEEKCSSPSIIRDNMDATKHMANGKMYDSKSEFRKATKASGCIEVGNDSSIINPKPRKFIEPNRRERREDIKRAIYQLKNS